MPALFSLFVVLSSYYNYLFVYSLLYGLFSLPLRLQILVESSQILKVHSELHICQLINLLTCKLCKYATSPLLPT